MLSICDENLIGRKIEDGKMILNLNSEFYKGKPLNKKELTSIIKEARIIHAVGKKSIDFLQNEKMVKRVSFVKKVPFAQVTYH